MRRKWSIAVVKKTPNFHLVFVLQRRKFLVEVHKITRIAHWNIVLRSCETHSHLNDDSVSTDFGLKIFSASLCTEGTELGSLIVEHVGGAFSWAVETLSFDDDDGAWLKNLTSSVPSFCFSTIKTSGIFGLIWQPANEIAAAKSDGTFSLFCEERSWNNRNDFT